MASLVSKKFAIIFTLLIFFVTLGAMGAIFTVFRLHAEGAVATMQRIDRERVYQRASARHHDIAASRAQFSALSAEAQAADELYFIGRYMPVFANFQDNEPKAVLSLHIVEVLQRLDSWKRVRSIHGEKWINTDWLPPEILLNVPSFNQQALGLPTGCEIVALAMVVAMYSDADVFALIEEMPRNYDPMLGFRGDPFTRGGFTILPPALMELTERHIGSAVDMTGASVQEVQAQLARGRPVLTWLRGMFGFTVHVITLTGFNEYGFFYNDPWLGGVNEFITYEDFLSMWDDPIRDLRLNRVYPPRIALSY